MNVEQELKTIKRQLASLNEAFLQAQRNNVSTVAKTDDSANNIKVHSTEIDKTEANVDYIAMMTDVELPEEGI